MPYRLMIRPSRILGCREDITDNMCNIIMLTNLNCETHGNSLFYLLFFTINFTITFYYFISLYALVSSLLSYITKCAFGFLMQKSRSGPRGTRRRGTHAMAQMTQWVIRP